MTTTNNTTSITIHRKVLSDVYNHAKAHSNNEVVGVFAQTIKRAHDAVDICLARPLVNISACSKNSYHVDSSSLLQAERWLLEHQLQTVGYYHSHPHGPHNFSLQDLMNMQQGLYYGLITKQDKGWSNLNIVEKNQHGLLSCSLTMTELY